MEAVRLPCRRHKIDSAEDVAESLNWVNAAGGPKKIRAHVGAVHSY